MESVLYNFPHPNIAGCSVTGPTKHSLSTFQQTPRSVSLSSILAQLPHLDLEEKETRILGDIECWLGRVSIAANGKLSDATPSNAPSNEERPDTLLLSALQSTTKRFQSRLANHRFRVPRANFCSAVIDAQINEFLNSSAPSHFEISFLHFAALANRPQLARFLVSVCGCPVDAPVVALTDASSGFWTALMLAVQRDNVAVVAVLLTCGADALERDAFGFTALTHAVCSYSELSSLQLSLSVQSVTSLDNFNTSLEQLGKAMGQPDLQRLGRYIQERDQKKLQVPSDSEPLLLSISEQSFLLRHWSASKPLPRPPSFTQRCRQRLNPWFGNSHTYFPVVSFFLLCIFSFQAVSEVSPSLSLVRQLLLFLLSVLWISFLSLLFLVRPTSKPISWGNTAVETIQARLTSAGVLKLGVREFPFNPDSSASNFSVSDQRKAFIQAQQQATDAMKPTVCFSCLQFRNHRTFHCRRCQQCVNLLDHHCIFLGGCIGGHQDRLFFLFLLCSCFLQDVQIAGILWTWVVQAAGFQILSVATFVIHASSVYWMHCLAAEQSRNVCSNVTMYEQFKSPNHFWHDKPVDTADGVAYVRHWRNPFNKGWRSNCLDFWTRSSRSETIDFAELRERDMEEFWSELHRQPSKGWVDLGMSVLDWLRLRIKSRINIPPRLFGKDLKNQH